MDSKKAVDEEEIEKKKEEEEEVEDKARLEDTRKAMKEVEVDRNLLQNEKTKLEQVVSERLKDGYGSKEKLEQIKGILES
ncbi:hypothetical protein ZWY2020_008831 [Hordeum vulgare]|nr:hypothetical protein ZWY2020_008831 [Hordeum vulgare]